MRIIALNSNLDIGYNFGNVRISAALDAVQLSTLKVGYRK